jgi:phospholipase C
VSYCPRTRPPDISFIGDLQYLLAVQELPSIFSQLDTAKGASQNGEPTWKLYFHDYSISYQTVPYVKAAAVNPDNVNVATFDDTDWEGAVPGGLTPLGNSLDNLPNTFLEDVSQGTLPFYSFIEPRYGNDISAGAIAGKVLPNSNHPGNPSFLSVLPLSPTNAPIDVSNGELLLAQIYNALSSSACWDNTLLIATHDEHGGVFDHVPPPEAPPPVSTTGDNPIAIPTAGAAGADPPDTAAVHFNYNVFGGRVPAIVIGKYIQPGSRLFLLKDSVTPTLWPFDHTSIIRTVWECFDLSTPGITYLTQRDRQAPSLMTFINPNLNNSPGPYPPVHGTASE